MQVPVTFKSVAGSIVHHGWSWWQGFGRNTDTEESQTEQRKLKTERSQFREKNHTVRSGGNQKLMFLGTMNII